MGAGDAHPVLRRHEAERSVGERTADTVAAGMGSWRFIIIQSLFVAAWILLNLVEVLGRRWDPYPFILLNLLFSTQAAYAAPVIMMSQNRAAARDRDLAQHDYDLNRKDNELLTSMSGLLAENTRLTEAVERLTREVHDTVVRKQGQL